MRARNYKQEVPAYSILHRIYSATHGSLLRPRDSISTNARQSCRSRVGKCSRKRHTTNSHRCYHSINKLKPTNRGKALFFFKRMCRFLQIPLAKLEHSPLFSIQNLFMNVEQSKKEQDASILGAPIEVDITIAQGGTYGAGRPRMQVKHNVQNPCLIEMKVPTGDAYCLFAAVELARLYVSKELDRKNGYPRLLFNPERMRQQFILPLLRAANIPQDLLEYNVEEHLALVQACYDIKYPGRYEILVFSSYGVYKPSWRSCKDRRQQPLFIFHRQEADEAGHFFGVRSIRTFLDKDDYCTFCETPYKDKRKHRFACKAKCANCSEIGPNYPCQPQPAYLQTCADCDKMFLNALCFSNHKQNRVCNSHRRCTACGVIYARSVPHECGSTFCRTCNVYHQRDAGCYITKTRKPKWTAYRFVVYDMETSQDKQISPTKFEHEVNFISSNTICSVCIYNDRWKRPLRKGECTICGDYRRRTWSVRAFHETAVCKAVFSANPMEGFLDWLLHDLDTRWKTIALAHNGGRFDAVLLLGEIYRQGSLCPILIRQGTKIFTMEVCLLTQLCFHAHCYR